MLAQATGSLLWPGISQDISRVQELSGKCTIEAPTQPKDPADQEYLLQMFCADFFSIRGMDILVIVNRYSN